MKPETKNSHGGPRPGAGRPKAPPPAPPEPLPTAAGYDRDLVLGLASQGVPADIIAGTLGFDQDAPATRDEFRRLCELGLWRFKCAKFTRAYEIGIVDAKPSVLLALLRQEPTWNAVRSAEDLNAVEQLRKIFETYDLAHSD